MLFIITTHPQSISELFCFASSGHKFTPQNSVELGREIEAKVVDPAKRVQHFCGASVAGLRRVGYCYVR